MHERDLKACHLGEGTDRSEIANENELGQILGSYKPIITEYKEKRSNGYSRVAPRWNSFAM